MQKRSITPHFPRLEYIQEHFPGLLDSKYLWVNSLDSEFSDKHKPSVAIIGTRHPSAWGKMCTRALVGALAKASFNIVSGGAMGIDACAHWAALEHGLTTQAWVVGPNKSPSPRSNSPLFNRIASTKGCAIITPDSLEPPSGRSPAKHFWIKRNAWIVASSDLVVVIEANEKSGTWASVKIAAELGVDVYALRGSINHPQSIGTNKMISMGYAMPLELDTFLTNCLLDAPLSNSYNLVKRPNLNWGPSGTKTVAEKAQFFDEAADKKLRSADGLAMDEAYSDPRLAVHLMKLLEKGLIKVAGNRLYRRE